MNLIEALKTGRPLRRRGENCRQGNGIIVDCTKHYVFPNLLIEMGLTIDDIMADDWEVKKDSSKKVVTTANEVMEALHEAYSLTWPAHRYKKAHVYEQLVAEKLGII